MAAVWMCPKCGAKLNAEKLEQGAKGVGVKLGTPKCEANHPGEPVKMVRRPSD